MQAVLLLGCSSRGGGKSARDRNLFLEEPLSVILLIFSVVVSPLLGSPCPAPPVGNRGAPLPGLPCTWLPGLFEKERHNRGEYLSKKEHSWETTSSPAFPLEEKLTPSTCQGISIPSLVLPGGPETVHNAEPRKRSLQPKLAPLQPDLDLLPLLGDMDGVIC